MIDIPKITATINTEEVETVELPPIVATIETKENFVELPKVVANIRPETAIVGNLGTMVAGKGKDGKDGVDGRPGKDGIDGKPGRDGINGRDGKDGTTPHIGDNGNWFIDDFDTGVCAIGKTGETGAPGKDGYAPRLGIDYFNGKDGRDGVDGKPGKDGKNGRTPIKGVDYKDGKDGKDGLNGLNGKNGFSPVVSIEEIDSGHRVIITDENGEKSFDVMDGSGGNGGNGNDGFSPTITVEEIIGGHRLTITDVDGTETVDVFNGINGKDGEPGEKGDPGIQGEPGANGADGQPGKDGYTPQRGTDYWTPADIQAMVADAVNGVLAQKSTILERAYPVGAIYMSTASTNPKNLFGFGTWEQVKDTFLLAAGNTYAAGSTGGEATHKLTIDEMPNHRHQLRCGSTDGTDLWVLTDVKVTKNQYSEFRSLDYIQHTGGDQPHNNMPPYLAVYVWKRTA